MGYWIPDRNDLPPYVEEERKWLERGESPWPGRIAAIVVVAAVGLALLALDRI